MVNPDRNLYEPPYDDALMYEAVEEPRSPRGRPLIVLLSIVVLAAFAGVVWVAYNQGVKQGERNNPPVLSAEAGPTRITPEASEQAAVPHQDKLIYERLTGETDVPANDEQLLPAPEEPRTLPSPQETAAAPPPAAPSAPINAAPSESFTRSTSEEPGLDTTLSAVTAPPPAAPVKPSVSTPRFTTSNPTAEDITSALPPSESSAPPPAAAVVPPAPKPAKPKPAVTVAPPPPAAVAPAPEESLPAGEGGPTQIIPPGPDAPTTTPTQTAMLETPAPTKPAGSGSVTIQLGSFPTDALAAASWSKVKTQNSAVLSNYSPKFARAEVPGKGTWYRLQVTGFPDRAAAAEVCNQLKANGQACIIATK